MGIMTTLKKTYPRKETLEGPSLTNPPGPRRSGSGRRSLAPAALANAVLEALAGFGVCHLDTLLTAEKIWHAMQVPP